MSKIKAFRGKLTSDNSALNQDTIHLAGGDVDKGYRLPKLQIMPTSEHADLGAVVKVYKQKQSIVNEDIDFTEANLMGASIYRQDTANQYPITHVVIFDREVVNQDIYVTYRDNETAGGTINYYLELEQVKMSKGEQAVVNFSAALLHGEP